MRYESLNEGLRRAGIFLAVAALLQFVIMATLVLANIYLETMFYVLLFVVVAASVTVAGVVTHILRL